MITNINKIFRPVWLIFLSYALSIQANGQNAGFLDHGFIPKAISADLGFQAALYDGGYIYVATNDGIWKNDINTKEWTMAGLQGKTIVSLFKHPTIANKFFAGAYINADPNFPTPNTNPLFTSNDAGATWNAVPGPVNENYYCFAVRPNYPNHIYANVEGPNMAVSTDGGNSWVFMNNNQGGFIGYQSAIIFKPNNPNQIFQGAEAPLDDAWLGSYDIDQSNPVKLTNFKRIVKGAFSGGPWENRRPNKLMMFPFTGNTIYVGQEGALSKVNDTISTFIYKSRGEVEKPYSYIKGIWVDPLDTNHIIFGGGLNNDTQPMQIFETFNEGTTFYRYSDKFGAENPIISDMVDLGDNKIAILISDQTRGNYKVKLLVMQPRTVLSNEDVVSEDQIVISPNPSNDFIQIELGNIQFSKLELKLNNVLGQEVYKSASQSKSESIEISRLENGLYYLYISIDDRTVIKKIRKY